VWTASAVTIAAIMVAAAGWDYASDSGAAAMASPGVR